MSDDSDSCPADRAGEHCGASAKGPENLILETHPFNSIKKVIAVVSGKGGVGKSIVTSMLAVLMNRRGFKTGILDADITGPSIPRIFGVSEKACGDDMGFPSVKSSTGIGIMSVNLLLPNDTDPVVWRGPIIANTVKQFWSEVLWGKLDYLFIDMPPGTGDVPLTVFQSIPVDGIVIVTSPQELVSMIVSKAVNMAKMMNIPILGLVENMGYLQCPDCGKEIKVFGESHIERIAAENGIADIARLPIHPRISAACDAGEMERFEGGWLDKLADSLETCNTKGKNT